MTDKATQLIADFKEEKWKAPQLYERLFALYYINKQHCVAFYKGAIRSSSLPSYRLYNCRCSR